PPGRPWYTAAMSERQAALLRGINVGRAKRVAMAELRAAIADLGYTDVTTLLNSGNVAYGTTDPLDLAEQRITAAIADRCNVRCRVMTVDAAWLGSTIDADPLGAVATDPSRYLVAVLAPGIPAGNTALDAVVAADWGPERVAAGPRAVYLWCPGGILDSPLAAAFGKATSDRATVRNWSTLCKLRLRVCGSSGGSEG
ncbi:MAG: DUF1697 domain-containing protein, partial [Myxococcota bacterium]